MPQTPPSAVDASIYVMALNTRSTNFTTETVSATTGQISENEFTSHQKPLTYPL